MLKFLSGNKEQCNGDVHIKEINMYCQDCLEVICRSCVKSKHHKHSINDVDDQCDEVIRIAEQQMNKILDLRSLKNKDKDEKQKEFDQNIQQFYDDQLVIINNHFRLLHDSLHVQEVDIKRELKSYHEENQEKLTKVISTLENDLYSQQQLITQFGLLYESKKSPTINNNDITIEKINFLKSYTSLMKEMKSISKSTSTISYVKYKLDEDQSNDLLNSIQSMKLKSDGFIFNFKNNLNNINNTNTNNNKNNNINEKDNDKNYNDNKRRAIGLYNFEASSADELSFKEGQILVILRQDIGGWCEALDEKLNKRGWIPQNYISFDLK